MIRRLIALTVFLAFSAGVAAAQSAGAVHQALTAEASRLVAYGSDPVIVEFVRTQNAKQVPIEEIERIDKEWIAGGAAAMVHAVTTGPCADYLRKTFSQQDHWAEVFLMDDRGALVCANGPTTDYWQGDEDKWIRSFNNGAGTTFIDRPRHDESSKLTMAQISIPVNQGGRTLGVLMVGVKVDKLLARK